MAVITDPDFNTRARCSREPPPPVADFSEVTLFRGNLSIEEREPPPGCQPPAFTLGIRSATGDPLLRVRVSGVTDHDFASAVERLYSPAHTSLIFREGRHLISPDALEEFLGDLERMGASLHVFRERREARLIARYYRQHWESGPVAPAAQPETSYVPVTNGKECDSQNGIRWNQLRCPSAAQVRTLAIDLGVPLEDFERCLLKDEEPSVKVRNGHMVLVLNEVVEDPKARGKFARQPIFLIVTQSGITSICHGKSYVLERVEAELRTGENPLPKGATPPWLAARILGSTIHRAVDLLAQLDRESKMFREAQGPRRRTSDSNRYLNTLIDSANEIETSVHAMGEAITALQQEDLPFCSQTPKPSLQRYPSRLDGIQLRLGQVRERLRGIEEAWTTSEEQAQSRIAQNLAELGVLFVPMGMVLGYFEVYPNVASNLWQHVCLAAAGALSVGVIGSFRHFSKRENGNG